MDEHDHAQEARRDPYAPPRTQDKVPTPRARGSAWTWAYGIVVGLNLAMFVVVNALYHLTGRNYWHLVALPEKLFPWVEWSLAGAWVHAAWSGLPPDRRIVSARSAARRLFIPFYNYYWVLKGTLALCDALDGILADADQPKRAPRELGLLASVGLYVLIVPGIMAFGPLGSGSKTGSVAVVRWWVGNGLNHLDHLLWLAYAVACDDVRATAAQLVAPDPLQRLAASMPIGPGTTKLARPRSRALVGLWVVVAVGVLGSCWQALQPKTRVPRDASLRPAAPP
jgi:hypothetical protein